MWTGEQGVRFSGLNKAFEVTLPAIPCCVSALSSFPRCQSARLTGTPQLTLKDETSS